MGGISDLALAEVGRQSRSTLPSACSSSIDEFKSYNDLYGHLEGDICPRRIAEALQSVLHRPADLLARLGGEEFVVLLPLTDEAGLKRSPATQLELLDSPTRPSTQPNALAAIPTASPASNRL